MEGRKYFKIKARRVPPYYPLNSDYLYEEHVYAFSEEGAERVFYNYYKKSFGNHYALEITEIPKSEFKGHHHTTIL